MLTVALLAIICGALPYFINGRCPQLVALVHAYVTWLTFIQKGEHGRWEAEVALPTEFGAKIIVLHAEDVCRRCMQKIITKVAKPRKQWFKVDLPELASVTQHDDVML